MKKHLTILLLLTSCMTVMCQTGTGWKQITTKQNFSADVNFAKAVMIGGVTVTSTAAQINILHSLTATATELNYVHNVTGPIQTQISSLQSQINLKAPINSPVFTNYVKINTDTAATRAYVRARAVIDTSGGGSKGGASVWGDLTGSIVNQGDLQTALDAKANKNNAAFIGSTTGITAAMVAAMSTSHAANAITGTNITNWNSAYGWGNHALAGYLTTQTSHADVVVDGDFASNGILKRTASGVYGIVPDNSGNWNTSYSWGNHASAGYAPLNSPQFTTGITTPKIIIGSQEVTSTATELNLLHNLDPNLIHISQIPTVPTIVTAAGDTSNYPVPGKIGDIFIDTSGNKVYISKSALRNGWLKLN